MEGFRKEAGGSEELRQIQQEIGRIHEEGRKTLQGGRTLEDGKISQKSEKNWEECGRTPEEVAKT